MTVEIGTNSKTSIVDSSMVALDPVFIHIYFNIKRNTYEYRLSFFLTGCTAIDLERNKLVVAVFN